MPQTGQGRSRPSGRPSRSVRRILGGAGRTPRFKGIRFRLGVALAAALLPILILGAFQAQSEFARQAEDRRDGLQLAAGRTAANAKARIDTATVLLEALAQEPADPGCAERLSALAERLEGVNSIHRLDASGASVCGPGAPSDTDQAARMERQPWFQRLARGEAVVLARAGPGGSDAPSLIVGVRVARSRGGFAGAMVAVLPLNALQPDVADPSLPSDTAAALTDGAGQVLVSTNPKAFDIRGDDALPGWVERSSEAVSPIFDAYDARGEHRDYAGAALAGRDVYVIVSAPSPGLLSWARLNPIGALFLPIAAWVAAFICVMTVSERIVVRWLDYLERIAALYARGRYSVRPVQAANAPAEIRNLAGTLDELAEAVTERGRSLTESLSEKDALMREIHHRVKNNLQIISSLLSMQQRALKDEPAKAALGDTRQRISALALIYRTLYQSEDIRHADARDFLNELVGQLVASESGRGPLVSSSIEADSLIVDPDKLAPLALWLVEAVSNAQKHAFAGRGGRLQVRFKVDGDMSVLEVQDDGPGPAVQTGSTGVGRTLMGAFAKQLRGNAELVEAPGGGSIARMVFATPEAAAPTDPRDLERSEEIVRPGTLSRAPR